MLSLVSVYEVYVTAGESLLVAVNTHQLLSYMLLARGILPYSYKVK